MLRGNAWKWLLIGSAFTVLILYMLELTSSGIERVYGPMESNPGYALQLNPNYDDDEVNESVDIQQDVIPNVDSNSSPLEQEIATLEQEIALLKKQALEQEKVQLQQQLLLNENAGQPAVNQFADKTSGVLQEASSSGLKYVAQLFSKMIN